MILPELVMGRTGCESRWDDSTGYDPRLLPFNVISASLDSGRGHRLHCSSVLKAKERRSMPQNNPCLKMDMAQMTERATNKDSSLNESAFVFLISCESLHAVAPAAIVAVIRRYEAMAQ